MMNRLSALRAVALPGLALGCLLLAALTASCRADVCSPGSTVDCLCTGGLAGTQICSPDGRSLSDCRCFGIFDGGPADLVGEDPPADLASDEGPDADGTPDEGPPGDGTPVDGRDGDSGGDDLLGDGASDGPTDATDADGGPGDGPGPPAEPVLDVALSGALGTGQACTHAWDSLDALAFADGFQITAQCEPGVAGSSGDLTQLQFRVAPDGSYTCRLASHAPGTCPAGSPCEASCGGEAPRPTTHLSGRATVQAGRAQGSCTCIDDDVDGGFTASFDLPL